MKKIQILFQRYQENTQVKQKIIAETLRKAIYFYLTSVTLSLSTPSPPLTIFLFLFSFFLFASSTIKIYKKKILLH